MEYAQIAKEKIQRVNLRINSLYFIDKIWENCYIHYAKIDLFREEAFYGKAYYSREYI